jgi:thiol-disulfide isomerase/thioredoxin
MQARSQVLKKYYFAAMSLVVTLALASCGGAGSTAETGYVSGDGSTVLVAQAKRDKPIELAGTSLDDEPIDIAQWRGDVVVINLWASWCAPCRSEAVTLEKVAQQLAPENVHFLGLNTRDGKAAAIAFNKRFPVGYPSIQDEDGTLTLVFGNLGPAATPTTIILDRQGRVAARILGPVEEAQLRDVTEAVVDEQ